MKEKFILDFKDDKKLSVNDWIDFYQKNKPQTNALSMGLMVILYSGEQCAWGVFNNHLTSQPWAGGYEDEGEVSWAIASWFVASIFGFIISAKYVNKCQKISIYVSFLHLFSITYIL
jgi:hypothetical protein